MVKLALSLIASLGIMLTSEAIFRETKEEYEKVVGSWGRVLRVSIAAGLIGGLISISMFYFKGIEDYSWVIVAASVNLGYLLGQSIMTDFTIKLVDRYVLRIGYVFSLILSLILVFRYEQFADNFIPVLLTFVLFVLLFLFVDIGMSDVRSIFAVTSISSALYAAYSLQILLVVIAGILIYQKLNEAKFGTLQAIPIAPVFILPYALIIATYPVSSALLYSIL